MAHEFVVQGAMPGEVAGQTNDLCPGADAIGGVGVFSFDNTTAESDGPTHEACATVRGAEIDHDVWYCWTSPCDGPVTVDTTRGTTVDTKLAVYRGCNCPPTDESLLGCNDDTDVYQSEVTFEATVGESYLIRLGTHPGLGGGMGTFRVRCGEGDGPVCTSFGTGWRATDAFNSTRGQHTIAERMSTDRDETISSITWSGGYFDGTGDCTEQASDDFEVRYYADDCGLPGEMWAGPFRQSDVTLTMTGVASSCSTLDGGIPYYVYTADHAPVDFLAGGSYWIEITNAGAGACGWYWRSPSPGHKLAMQDGAWNDVLDGYDETDGIARGMSVSFIRGTNPDSCYGPYRPHDLCADALPLFEGETFFGTVGALASGPPVPTCEFPLDDDQIRYDVWYNYVAPCTGVVTLDVCDANFDTKLAVYERADCTNVDRVVACNDDACGDEMGRQSSTTFAVQAGQPYKVRIGAPPASYRAGTGTLYLTFEPKPPAKTDLFDLAELMRCFTGACPDSLCDPPLYGEACCGSYDYEVDGDVDADDFSAAHGGFVGPAARSEMCGDGIVESGEECDDGNLQPGDGCNADCHLEFGVVNDDCAHAATITDGETPFDTWYAKSEGFDVPGCPLPVQAWVDHDIWYRYTATCAGQVTVNVCDTDFDSRAVLYMGGSCDWLRPLACGDDECASGGAVVTYDAWFTQPLLIRIGGVTDVLAPPGEDRSRGTGTVTVFCGVPSCGEGQGSCYAARTGPGCNQESCCESVCAVDPSCCFDAWDAACAQAAFEVCSPDSCGGSESCRLEHDSPGCRDRDCCLAVCGENSICCDIIWNSDCVDLAGQLCPQ